MSQEAVLINAKRMPGAEFWAMHLPHLPIACRVAKIVLSKGASASQAERNWKIYGRIKTPARARMSHAKADKRVFLYQHLQMQHKVKDASYKPAFVEWEEASTDEDEPEAAALPTLEG